MISKTDFIYSQTVTLLEVLKLNIMKSQLLTIGLIFYTSTLFAQKFSLIRFLGLSGNTYRTEVRIPIKTIRYQADSTLPEVQIYTPTTSSTSVNNITTAAPVSSAGGAPTTNTTENTIVNVPIMLPPSTVQTTTNKTSNLSTVTTANTSTVTTVTNTDVRVTTQDLPYVDPGIVYTLLSEPVTGAPVFSVRPLVRFIDNTTGLPFTPDATHRFPPPGYHLAICNPNDAGIIQSNEYLFQPDGGKMPDYSQQLRHEWFVSGPFSAMIRYRPPIDSFQKLGTVAENWSIGASLAIVTGTKHNLIPFGRYGRGYKMPMYLQFPIAMFGVSTVDVTRRIDTDNDGLFDAYAEKESRLALTLGTGVGFQIWKFAIMPVVGWDFLLGTEKNSWQYQGKVWYGGSIGLSLDKLIGAAK